MKLPANKHRVDAIVIGGGLIGLGAARSLRQRGLEVMLLEATSIARHASSASAGGVRSLNRHPAEITLARAALPMWSSLSRELGHSCGFQVSGQLRIAEDDAAVEALQARSSMTSELGYTQWHEESVSTITGVCLRNCSHCVWRCIRGADHPERRHGQCRCWQA